MYVNTITIARWVPNRFIDYVSLGLESPNGQRPTPNISTTEGFGIVAPTQSSIAHSRRTLSLAIEDSI